MVLYLYYNKTGKLEKSHSVAMCSNNLILCEIGQWVFGNKKFEY